MARNHIVPTRWKNDFEALASQPIWQGQKLGTLLTHVELANYTVHELINWEPDNLIYRNYVLSPTIDSESDAEMTWRRPLWEYYCPRVRGKPSPKAAAETVASSLREHVTIWPAEPTNTLAPKTWPRGIQTIWDRQITDPRGFELIYVATLRSVGVPARLNAFGNAEFWDGDQWCAAPHPLLNSWKDLTNP
jgi:hypothetical protein